MLMMGGVQLTAILKNDIYEEKLYYEFDKEYESFICDDRCDGIVVSVILSAMKFGYDVIESDIPISEELYYNLTYHVIPQLYVADKGKYKKIKIIAPLTSVKYQAAGVAAGLSRGVDSFATIYEYGNNCELDNYKITHYTYFNAGAHHGQDTIVGKSKYTRKELYDGELQGTIQLCLEQGYKLIVVDSNLAIVLASENLFGRWYFNRTHTYRNLGIALLLQKGISKYYYSSAYNLDQFSISVDVDVAHYEKWLIRHLGTENISFYSSNQEWLRIEKAKHIANIEESYNYLHVCLVDIQNCGKCTKCRRTLMELDALGESILDKYSKSFDLDKYRREDQRKWFTEIWNWKEKKDGESVFFREIFLQALKTNPQLLQVPIILKEEDRECSIVVTNSYCNIREFPDLNAKIISRGLENEIFHYWGEWGEWIKISGENIEFGYVHKSLIKKVKHQKEEITIEIVKQSEKLNNFYKMVRYLKEKGVKATIKKVVEKLS